MTLLGKILQKNKRTSAKTTAKAQTIDEVKNNQLINTHDTTLDALHSMRNTANEDIRLCEELQVKYFDKTSES